MQLYFGIVLATITALAAAGPVNSPGIVQALQTSDLFARNSLLEQLLWSIIDTTRDVMVNGSDDIPVLDPFLLDELHLEQELEDLGLPNSHVTVKALNVLNLSKFEVDSLSVSVVNIILQRYRITLDGRIPVLEVNVGNYDLSIPIFGGHVFGNGDVKLKIINPRVHGHLVVGLRLSINGIFLSVNECRLNFDLQAFEPEITGLFGNQVSSEFASVFLKTLIPEMVEFFAADITDILSSTVYEIANEILRDLNLGSLLP